MEEIAYHDGKEIQMDSIEREERRKIDGSEEKLKVFAEGYKNNQCKEL